MSKERDLLVSCLDEFQYHEVPCSDLIRTIQWLLNEPEQTEQEPVAWMWDEMFCDEWTTVSSVIKPSKSKYVDNVRPLYLAPPKREPLSDEEVIAKYRAITLYAPSYYAGFRDAEKAHGIT
jgi:hypothetical protein